MSDKLKDKEEIAKQIKKYVDVILTEYQDNISDEVKNYLSEITNYSSIINIEDTNTISLFVKDGEVYLPLSAYKVIEAMKKIPGFGVNKNHITHQEDDIIINNNTFIDYIKHVFIKGLTPLEYFLEILLHETMHLCGADGFMGLKEGFTELKTRQLASKYNLKTSACGYPKEVKIASLLESILGKDVCDKLTFMKNEGMIFNMILNEVGEAEAYLYLDVLMQVEKKFKTYMEKDFPGITGPIKKAFEYAKLNYSEVKILFDNYYQNKELADNNRK